MESFKVSEEIHVPRFVFLYLLPNVVIKILIKIQLVFFFKKRKVTLFLKSCLVTTVFSPHSDTRPKYNRNKSRKGEGSSWSFSISESCSDTGFLLQSLA